jgi:Collagen triple helix repeat (20 copies)
MRRHLNYANVVATFALLFAMSGGALAAKHYLINSTSQINPKVVKSLKGKAGPTGPAGSAGSAGKEGPAGKEGGTGKEGKEGKEGKTGAPGATDVVTRYGGEETVETGDEVGSYAACDSEEAVTGGGYDFPTAPTSSGKFYMTADRPSDQTISILTKPAGAKPDLIPIFFTQHPAPSNGSPASGWLSAVKNETGSSFKIRSYVICASP